MTIAGNLFTGATAVQFNGTQATFTTASDTQLVAKVPVGATTGPVGVRNNLGLATSMSDFIVAIPPMIAGFSPMAGNAGDVQRAVGDEPHRDGADGHDDGADLDHRPDGHGASALDFTISNPVAPTVSSVSPSSGSTAGGTMVTVKGLAFAAGATVKFGATAATAVTFTDATTLVAMSPALPEGTVSIEVTNPDMQKGTLANAYTYFVPSADGGTGGGAGGGASGGTGGAGGRRDEVVLRLREHRAAGADDAARRARRAADADPPAQLNAFARSG